MRSHCILKISIALLVLTSRHLVAQGNLVINGTFDTDASGWVTNNIGRDGGYYSGKGNPGGFYLLDNTPAPGVSPTISQTVNGLNPGSEYIIFGSYVWSLGLGDTFSTDTPRAFP
jgi:hypothetical protein